jgi:hypothetical protein
MDNNMPRTSTLRAETVAKGDRGGAGIMILLIAMLIVVVAAASQFGPLKRYLSPPPPSPMPVAAAPAVDAPPSLPPASPAPAPQITRAPEPEVVNMPTLMLKEPPPAQADAQPALPSLPAGEAGLVEAMRKGLLRPASGGDLAAWKSRWSQANRRGLSSSFDERTRMMSAYVIQRDFEIPGGLHGAHAVVFVLDKGVPYPRGSAGHSVILDQATGACMGPVCDVLLE